MLKPIVIVFLSASLVSGCSWLGLKRGLGLNRAIENSMERTSEPEAAEFVMVNNVPMTVSIAPGRDTAWVRSEAGTASADMMVQAAESASGCAAEPLGDLAMMTGQASDQALGAEELRRVGGTVQMVLTC